MTVSLVVITDSEYGIGKDGKTPWYFPAHQEYFERLVHGHPVVMGRNTFESRGPVPDSINMVVTNHDDYQVEEPGVMTGTDLHMAIERCKWVETDDNPEIFVVGGAELFEHCMAGGLVDKIYLTHIPRKTYECDVFFPDQYLHDSFNESHRTVRYSDEENNERLEFVVYNRRRADQPKDKKKTQ